MKRNRLILGLCGLLVCCATNRLDGQHIEKDPLAEHRRAGLNGGDPATGKSLFESDEVGCTKCHVFKGDELRRGTDLGSIGDKFGREQLVQSVLEPNARIHPDYGTIVATRRTARFTRAYCEDEPTRNFSCSTPTANSCDCRSPRSKRSKGPAVVDAGWAAQDTEAPAVLDLIAYLEASKQSEGEMRLAGMPSEIPVVEKPIRLVPLPRRHAVRHPVWIIAIPGSKGAFLVVEQKTRKIWRLDEGDRAPEGTVRRLQQRSDDRRIRGRRVCRVPPAVSRKPQVLRELSRSQSRQFLLAGDRRAASGPRPAARRGNSFPAIVADSSGH